MAGKPCVPQKSAKADVREGFDSGAPELDEWLEPYSWQNQRANNTVTYGTVLDGRVVGYYAIAVSSVARELALVAVVKGASRHVPCPLLARLAVDRDMQGYGLGRDLLVDALKRTAGLGRLRGHTRTAIARARRRGSAVLPGAGGVP
ncbi:MAG: GNAT family N-acetyltransferase [Pseudonocardiaceae bacterium]